jgi:hypothetical protein
MQYIIIFFITLLVTVTNGFRVSPAIRLTVRSNSVQLFSSTEEPPKEPSKRTDLVPLEKANIESAAALTGGVLGFAVGGPVIGLILAAISNYVSKKDSDAGTALRGFGTSAIESYNFVRTLNGKYDVSGAVSSQVNKLVISGEGESEGFKKVTKTWNDITLKISEISEEFDILGKSKQIVTAAGDLTDAALEKVEELNGQV